MTTTDSHMKKIYLYTRFERLWHWLQAFLIIMLMITGLEIHGTYTLFGYKKAVSLHNFFGLTWLILFVFIIFWLSTTGEWKQYIPTTKKMLQVMKYYAYGIFKGEPHPVEKRPEAKHNPLQRLAYLGLATIQLPFQMITGLLYYTYNDWGKYGIQNFKLGYVAFLHMAGAFAILTFLIVHIYMTTTGHTITAHVKAMITGWEEVRDEASIAEWERARTKGKA